MSETLLNPCFKILNKLILGSSYLKNIELVTIFIDFISTLPRIEYSSNFYTERQIFQKEQKCK